MKALLLNFVAPMYSWGYNSMSIGDRKTNTFPTKSAVVGLLNAATGKVNDFSYVDEIFVDVYTDDTYRIVKDTQNIGAGYDRDNWLEARMCITDSQNKIVKTGSDTSVAKYRLTANKHIEKEYISNTSYRVVVKSENIELLESLYAALKKPKYVLYFGSRNCIPSKPIVDKIIDLGSKILLSKPDNLNIKDSSVHYLVGYLESENGSQTMFDVPISELKYKTRHIDKVLVEA